MSAHALILAAGLGTRLRPLTDELPKPLVPVGDRPLLSHIAGRLRSSGFARIAVNVHHMSARFMSEIDGMGSSFHVIHEPEIRGTAGGVAGARAAFGAVPLLVWNGDILTRPPIDRLLAAAGGGGLCLAVSPRSRGEGTVGVDRDGRVVRLRGRSFGEESGGADYIGVAALGVEAVAAVPEVGCLIGDYALPALSRGETVLAVPSTEPFRDVGSLSSYLDANLEWLRESAGPRGSWVHPDARVDEGVEVTFSVVGAGARVEGSGVLHRSVLWPGVRVRVPLSGAIVSSLGRVVPVAEGPP